MNTAEQTVTGSHYWAEPQLTEFGVTVRVVYQSGPVWCTSNYGLDLNGAYGLLQSQARAERVAGRLNEAIRVWHEKNGSFEDAVRDASQGDILRAYYGGQVIWSADDPSLRHGSFPV